MQSKRIQKLLRKKKSDSGFTLLELLTGLTMSGIVIGVLGVGFYQVLKVTSDDASKSQAREQASRAIEFITDEIRRAKTIEPNADNANDNDGNGDNTFDTTDTTVVLALEIPEITSDQLVDIDGDGTSRMLGSDDDATTTERIVYYLKSTDIGSWKGPQVLYRWGPPLNANGDYTENIWTEEALIDGIDDTVIATNPCDTSAGETLNPVLADNPSGFYACISSANNAARIFLTGEVSTVGEQNTNFTSDTQVVARAKEADVEAMVDVPTAPLTFESLGARFNCDPNINNVDRNNDGVIDSNDRLDWGMRTDVGQFEDSATGADRNPSNLRKWVYNSERKQQPINIDPAKPLYITAIPLETDDPIDADSCLNSKFDNKDNHSLLGKDDWHDADGDGTNNKDIVYTQIKIDFNDPLTFNGNEKDGDHNSPDVDINGDGVIDNNDDKVKVFKQGTEVPDIGGYDLNGDGDSDDPEDQPSLGEFLAEQGYAYLDNDGKYKMYNQETYDQDTTNPKKKLLGDNQRIISFEIGQNDKNHPGFELQDSIFVVTSDAFKTEFESSKFTP